MRTAGRQAVEGYGRRSADSARGDCHEVGDAGRGTGGDSSGAWDAGAGGGEDGACDVKMRPTAIVSRQTIRGLLGGTRAAGPRAGGHSGQGARGADVRHNQRVVGGGVPGPHPAWNAPREIDIECARSSSRRKKVRDKGEQ